MNCICWFQIYLFRLFYCHIPGTLWYPVGIGVYAIKAFMPYRNNYLRGIKELRTWYACQD